MSSYHKTRNASYNLKYEIAWCVKWRRNLLKPPIDRTLKTILRQTCRKRGYHLEQLQVMSDYIHFLISLPPRVAPAEMVKHLKGVSARKLLNEYPELRQKLVQGHLWTSTYYAATVGTTSEDSVQSYIKSQRKKS